MNDPRSETPTKQDIFRELQAAERAAWAAREAIQVDEEDIYSTADRQRDEFFTEERRRLRREVSLKFGIGEQGLRAIEIDGVMQGWPLEVP